MRASRRKIWTQILTLSAAALVVVVVAAGAFRMLVKAVPGYRDDVEQRISDTLGRRVSIRELDLSWRRFRPSFDLLDVTLYGDDGVTPALKLRELNVGVDLLALLTARLRAADLRLVGIVLTAERLANGEILISGISTEQPLTVEELRSIARAVDRVGRVVIADGQVLWLDYTDPNTFHRIDDIDLELSTRGFGYRLLASAQLPAHFGGRLQMEARGRGDLDKFEELDINAELLAQDLRPGIWLQPWLRKGVALEGDDLRLQVDTRWRGRHLESATGQLRSGALYVKHGGELQPLAEDIQSELSLDGVEDGWQVTLDRLHIKAPARQPAQSMGRFEFRPATDDRPWSLTGSIDHMRLDEPGEWLALFDWGTQGWLAGLKPVGYVQDLRFGYRPAGPASETGPQAAEAFSIQGRFEDLGFSAGRGHPGMTGANGRVKLDASGGELLLLVNNGTLLAPEIFDQPFPVTLLNGTVTWKSEGKDWLYNSKELRWQGPGDLAGTADFDLRTFGSGASPRLNLDMSFAGQDIDAARQFIPRVPAVLDEEVRVWLHDAIRSARVSKGRMQIRGHLDHFPYHNPHEPGLFLIEFDVRDGVLAYAEGWPPIDHIDAHATFRGRSMRIAATQARILETPVGPVQADITDFQYPLLEITGDAKADAGRMLGFLAQSPLRSQYGALVEALALKGPAALDLRLEIPLDQLEATRVFGEVTLAGNTQLNHAKLPEPITAISGQVRFDKNGLIARDLRGDLLGLKLALQLDPEHQGAQHLTRLQAETDIAFPRDSARLARLVPETVLARLHGSSRWRADMLFDVSATPAQLRLESDLTGLEVDLPPPFAKAAADAVPIEVSLDPSFAKGLRADIRYGNLLSAALQLRDTEARWELERGHVLLGEGRADMPGSPGLWVDGRIAEFDVAQWQPWLSPDQPDKSNNPDKPVQSTLLLRGLDLRFGRLLVADQVLENLRMQLVRGDTNWQMQLSGQSAEGKLSWPQRPKGRPVYQADFERLVLNPLPPKSDSGDGFEETPDDAPPRDPGKLPGLSLRCRSLRVGKHEIGQLHLEAVPVPNGLSLATFSLTGDLNVQGSGNWTRLDGESSAQLSLSARGSQLKQLFAALGYAPSLEAEKIRLQSSLAWEPDADGIRTEALGGGFSLDLEKGLLIAVEPGAGRVLGLLNFYALPRRLTLDFRDVVSKGLAFDSLKGDFRIDKGNAWTDNLKIRGPSLKMEIEGRVGLAARDYDQKVTIHPEVSTGVALAGTAIGGPAVGLGLLLAQTLFKKPLEEMSELSYRLRGPWDNPTIEKGD